MHKFLMFWVVALGLAGQAFAGAPGKVIGATTVDSMFANSLLERNYVFIDIRPSADYQQGRVPGAINLEFNEGFTQAALNAIVPSGNAVVFYGIGILDDNNAKAVQQALDWGYVIVFYYRTGYAEWSTVGLPVEK